MASKDYSKEQPPKLGPFAQNPTPNLLSSSRRPIHYQGQTRQDRLRVPYYNKPMKVKMEKLEDYADDEGAGSNQSGFFQSIRNSASSIYNRILGRSGTNFEQDTQVRALRHPP